MRTTPSCLQRSRGLTNQHLGEASRTSQTHRLAHKLPLSCEYTRNANAPTSLKCLHALTSWHRWRQDVATPSSVAVSSVHAHLSSCVVQGRSLFEEGTKLRGGFGGFEAHHRFGRVRLVFFLIEVELCQEGARRRFLVSWGCELGLVGFGRSWRIRQTQPNALNLGHLGEAARARAVAMAPSLNKSSSMKKLSFFESGFSWFSFAAIMACALSCVYLLQLLIVSRYKCTSVQTSLSMVTQSDSTYFPMEQTSLPLPTTTEPLKQSQVETKKGTDLSRMVFAVAAAAQHWPDRKAYIRKWYNSVKGVRAIVWLDQKVNGTWDKDVPPFRISGDTSKFPFTFKGGKRSAIRISRIVSETFRLGLPDVDWFIMGDDDTLFFPENLAKMLSKYDHKKMYYIGSTSETHMQNIVFSYNMAYGGGGFAISYPLAKELAQMQDSCLMRYPHLFGSDDRIFSCMSELGVSLTIELGFHQMDIQGDALGLLAAHPQTPLLSLHHMDLYSPIFPTHTRYEALDHLLEAAKVESTSLLQQSICYADGQNWSLSVSWGYVVQVSKGFLTPRELETPLRTFYTLRRQTERAEFSFNTRQNPKDVCLRPSLFYMKSVKGPSANSEGLLESVYQLTDYLRRQKYCSKELQPLTSVKQIRVLKEPIKDSWFQTPRRSCCKVKSWSKDSIELRLSDCESGESLTSGIQ